MVVGLCVLACPDRTCPGCPPAPPGPPSRPMVAGTDSSERFWELKAKLLNLWILQLIGRKNPSQGIREAKRLKLNTHFMCSKDPQCLWQGFQHIADYKPPPPMMSRDNSSLPDELNNFFLRFEVTTPPRHKQFHCHRNCQQLERKARVNPRKAAGPDNICGHVL